MNNPHIKAPHSRIFVVCNKQLGSEDLRPRFEKFGVINNIYVPKDRRTGESKGFAYIEYAKTSSAASAIQELNMKMVDNDSKPMKVMLAINKDGGPTQDENEDKYRRLFIKVNKDVTENEIRNYFLSFGQVESVHFVKDKGTDMCKGFAYVLYKTFRDAAVAYEECDKKYKAMFATPRTDLKRNRQSLDNEFQQSPRNTFQVKHENFQASLSNNAPEYKNILVKCSPLVPQKYIEHLFNVIPGMSQCQYSCDIYSGVSTAIISYEEAKYAAFAVERLNNFEFPSGEIITVKPDKNPLAKAAYALTDMVNNFKNAVDCSTPDLLELADAIAQATTLIKVATSSQAAKNQDHSFCNVSLPAKQDIAKFNTKVAQRLFIICKPHPPPIPTLQDVFCRFGDLIDVSTFPNKTFGFVKYASIKAAQEAMKTLNGATVCGIRLKVLEADEKPSRDEDKVSDNNSENGDHDLDNKRMKLNSSDEWH